MSRRPAMGSRLRAPDLTQSLSFSLHYAESKLRHKWINTTDSLSQSCNWDQCLLTPGPLLGLDGMAMRTLCLILLHSQ